MTLPPVDEEHGQIEEGEGLGDVRWSRVRGAGEREEFDGRTDLLIYKLELIRKREGRTVAGKVLKVCR